MSNASLPPTNRSLPILLMRARERVMAPIREMLAETGITEQQWRILRVLAEQGALDATTLAQKASLLPPSLTRIAQSMLARGLITREADVNDRRRQTIAITGAGRRIIEDNLDAARQIAERHRTVLGPEQHEALLDLLEMLERG